MNKVAKNWVTIERGKRFRALNSNPQDWAFNKTCSHHRSQCQLCGTDIVWNFGLQNRITNKVIYVGVECIKWYYEAYMPNGLDLAIERQMKEARKQEKKKLILEKIKQFAQDGNFHIVNYLFGADKQSYRDGYIICEIDGATTKVRNSKFRASLRRKGYLRPDEIKAFNSGFYRKYDQEAA